MALRQHDDNERDLLGPLARGVLVGLRPGIGWPLGLLALLAAICPALAAAESTLRLPLGLLFWSAIAACVAGFRLGRQRPQGKHPQRVSRRRLGWLLIVGAGGTALVIAAANAALPAPLLVLQDLGVLLGRALAWLRNTLPSDEGPPVLRTWVFLASSLPRAWQDLLAAPEAGERGARLLVATASAALTWPGALLLGWALASGRGLLGWGLPLLAALLAITVLGGGQGFALTTGLGIVLLLAAIADFRRRERAWTEASIAYSDQLLFDVVVWSLPLICALLAAAWMLPSSRTVQLARWLWRDVEVPSGIAAIERQALPQPQGPTVTIALSELPALRLGQSLSEGPEEQLAARIRLAAPLPPAAAPGYWRARVLNIYTGQSWTTNALVEPLAANLPPTPISGTILQRVERARPDAELLLGLPNLIAAGTDAEAEYLADGTLAALRAPVASYEVLSSPPARVSAPDSAPPPLESYLRLPEELPPRVRDLAVAVAGEGPPQAQALALESYLRELPYTYEVRPLPGGDDAVDQFLFQMRHGYCTYYASAMAVLARSLGIPARIATGYAGGSFDAATNTYTLYERDAHAWPELYVDGRWVAYEPTPIRELPQRASNTQAAPPPDMALPEATPPRPLARAWPLALGLGALAVVGAGLWLWRRRRLPLLLRAQQHLEAYGLRRGVAWPPGATLQEYGALLSAEGGAAASSVGAVIGLLSRARYRRQQLSDDEQRQLREASERLVAASRRARRMERQR